MPIILPLGLTTPEIRVLQEFRRLNAETLPLDTIKAIKHPASGSSGGGELPAVSLVEKSYLETNGSSDSFSLTQKAKDFIAIDAKPEFEESGGTADSAAENLDAESV